jgi:hypothetical protein
MLAVALIYANAKIILRIKKGQKNAKTMANLKDAYFRCHSNDSF